MREFPDTLVLRIIRVLQLLLAVAVLGLSAYLVSLADEYFLNFSGLDFALFCGLFGALSVIYLVLTWFYKNIGHAYIILALDLLNTIFFLASFIDIAVNADNINCTNYFDTYCYYYDCYQEVLNALITRCEEFQAISGLAGVSFALWLASSIWMIRFIVVNRQSGPMVNLEMRNTAGMKDRDTVPEDSHMPEAIPHGRMMEDPDV